MKPRKDAAFAIRQGRNPVQGLGGSAVSYEIPLHISQPNGTRVDYAPIQGVFCPVHWLCP